MKIVHLIITAALTMLICAAPALGKVWRGLTPLRSTRTDVERLLGAPQPGTQTVYKTTDEVVKVTYAIVECDYDWRVRPNTVISIIIQPNQPSKFSDLKLVEKKLREAARSESE